jgi:predicted MFS family arabinose efflux permease
MLFGGPSRVKGPRVCHAATVRHRIATVLAVARSGRLRRIELAYLVFNIAEWATWIGVVVYAFERGGATEAALISFAQFLPSVVVAPSAAALGDRFPRERILFASYLLQAVAMAGTAVALSIGSPLVVYVLVTVTATVITTTRPVQSAFLPEIVVTPDELTAANVASGMIEGAGALIGPILAGVLVSTGGPTAVFAVTATGTGLAALAVLPIARRGPARDAVDPSGPDDDAPPPSVVRELVAGAATVARDRRLRWVVLLLAVTSGITGALDIFYAVLAIDVLRIGDGGIGFLGAATGVGTLAGSAVAVVLVGRQRLAVPLLASAALFGGAVAVVGIAPHVAIAVVLLVVAGIGSSVVYVAIQTATQRAAGDDVMSRVFGIEEAAMMAASCLGALLVPALLSILPPSGALFVAGLSLPVVAALGARTLVQADRAGLVHAQELEALQRIPMLMPLAGPVLERLAASASIQRAETGDTIITAGDAGDTFYAIMSGSVVVTVAGGSPAAAVAEPPRRLGPGDSFGEIALLRDVPRTATVRAVEPTELVVLQRGPFLEALTGQPRSRSLASRTVEERLHASPGASNPSER